MTILLRSNTVRLYSAVLFASTLLSVWGFLADPVVNRDGILYLRAADAFIQNGFRESLLIFNWPAYPVLLAGLSKITGLAPVHSAYVLNVLSYGILCLLFLSLVRELGGNHDTLVWAAVTVLVHPGLNKYRPYIVRDHAFWMLLLLAVLLMLRFARTPSWKFVAGWFVTIGFAALFKIETLAFGLFLPFSLFFQGSVPFRERLRQFLMIQAPLLTVLTLFALMFSSQNEMIRKSRVMIEVWRVEALSAKLKAFTAGAGATAEVALHTLSRKDGTVFIVFGLLGIFVHRIINTFHPLLAGMLVFRALGRRDNVLPANRALLFTYLAIGSGYLLFFLFTERYLQNRFTVPVTLGLLLWIPFSAADLWARSGSGEDGISWRRMVIVILAGALLLDGMVTGGSSKTHIDTAAHWVDSNVPSEARVFTNNEHIGYFGKRESNWRDLREHIGDKAYLSPEYWQGYDYLAFRLTKDEDALQKQIVSGETLLPVKTFDNGKGDRVVIYRRTGTGLP